MSMWCLFNVDLMLIRCRSDVDPMSIRRWSVVDLTSIRCRFDGDPSRSCHMCNLITLMIASLYAYCLSFFLSFLFYNFCTWSVKLLFQANSRQLSLATTIIVKERRVAVVSRLYPFHTNRPGVSLKMATLIAGDIRIMFRRWPAKWMNKYSI